MYAFNSLQITALFLALPWMASWCNANGYKPFAVICALLCAAIGLFLVVSATRSLYEVDKSIRGL
jgi:hypothetical protein